MEHSSEQTMSGHKKSHNEFLNIEITQIIFSDPDSIKLVMNYRKKMEIYSLVNGSRKILQGKLKKQQAWDECKQNIPKFVGCSGSRAQRKIIAVNAYIKKEVRSQTREEQTKQAASRRKAIIKD